MSEKQPEKPVIAESNIADTMQKFVALGLPLEWTEYITLRSIQVAELEASSPRYLELPAAVALLASDWWYVQARSHGRLCYRDGMFHYDEVSHEWTYSPRQYSREEIYEFLQETVLAHERPFLLMSLAWRVGFCVGWLSGLVVAQKDEAQAGLMILAALLAPLLPGWQQGKQRGSRMKKQRLRLKEGERGETASH